MNRIALAVLLLFVFVLRGQAETFQVTVKSQKDSHWSILKAIAKSDPTIVAELKKRGQTAEQMVANSAYLDPRLKKVSRKGDNYIYSGPQIVRLKSGERLVFRYDEGISRKKVVKTSAKVLRQQARMKPLVAKKTSFVAPKSFPAFFKKLQEGAKKPVKKAPAQPPKVTVFDAMEIGSSVSPLKPLPETRKEVGIKIPTTPLIPAQEPKKAATSTVESMPSKGAEETQTRNTPAATPKTPEPNIPEEEQGWFMWYLNRLLIVAGIAVVIFLYIRYRKNNPSSNTSLKDTDANETKAQRVSTRSTSISHHSFWRTWWWSDNKHAGQCIRNQTRKRSVEKDRRS